MKKILVFLAISLACLNTANANTVSIININKVDFYNGTDLIQEMPAVGTLYDSGGGSITIDEYFLGQNWGSNTQATNFMGNTGAWSGSTGPGSAADTDFDYDNEIAAMSADQIAVGLLFEWNNNPMAVLAIFECTGLGTVENPSMCVGVESVPMDNGVFIGSTIAVNAVPVPPAVWLFGSGLLGLVGMARRKKAA